MQPRKTYNTLVGQLFGVEPIKTDDQIDSTMRRKIQKLWEYLQANPAKVPKVRAGRGAGSGGLLRLQQLRQCWLAQQYIPHKIGIQQARCSLQHS